MTFKVQTAASSPSSAAVTQSLVESGANATVPGAAVKSTSITSPQSSASIASGAGAAAPAYAPASEENRPYAGVGDSALATSSYSSPTWGGRLKALAAYVWAKFKAYASALYAAALNNLFALIAFPALFLAIMWAVTTFYDAPRRAAWMRALAGGRDAPSVSLFGCGLCGTRVGTYTQQRPITHAVEPCFAEKDIPAAVPSRGPASALSPMAEPLMYVRAYDAFMGAIAGVTGYTAWAPPSRPNQGALAVRRIKQMQKFRFTDLAAHQAGAEEAEGSGAFQAANPLADGSQRRMTMPPTHPSQVI